MRFLHATPGSLQALKVVPEAGDFGGLTGILVLIAHSPCHAGCD